MEFDAIGIRGDAGFSDIVGHFTSLGGDVVLLDPDMVVGKGHALSAAMHARRAFDEGTNRSKSLPTEIIMYCAWERQIGKAMEKMRPKAGRNEYVAILMDIPDPKLDEIGMIRDDSLMDPTAEKAARLGLSEGPVQFEDQAMENVALLELQKV